MLPRGSMRTLATENFFGAIKLVFAPTTRAPGLPECYQNRSVFLYIKNFFVFNSKDLSFWVMKKKFINFFSYFQVNSHFPTFYLVKFSKKAKFFRFFPLNLTSLRKWWFFIKKNFFYKKNLVLDMQKCKRERLMRPFC